MNTLEKFPLTIPDGGVLQNPYDFNTVEVEIDKVVWQLLYQAPGYCRLYTDYWTYRKTVYENARVDLVLKNGAWVCSSLSVGWKLDLTAAARLQLGKTILAWANNNLFKGHHVLQFAEAGRRRAAIDYFRAVNKIEEAIKILGETQKEAKGLLAAMRQNQFCPVCGEGFLFSNNQCPVCGAAHTPDFLDPKILFEVADES